MWRMSASRSYLNVSFASVRCLLWPIRLSDRRPVACVARIVCQAIFWVIKSLSSSSV